MTPLFKFDQEGRPYRCYTPGIPLRYATGPSNINISSDEPLSVIDERGFRHDYSSAIKYVEALDGRDVREEVMQRARKYQHDHNVDYKTAHDRVLAVDEDLKKRYAESSGWRGGAG